MRSTTPIASGRPHLFNSAIYGAHLQVRGPASGRLLSTEPQMATDLETTAAGPDDTAAVWVRADGVCHLPRRDGAAAEPLDVAALLEQTASNYPGRP